MHQSPKEARWSTHPLLPTGSYAEAGYLAKSCNENSSLLYTQGMVKPMKQFQPRS
ncbi:hypothetical protein [Paenibacillus sediminis]|uniref:Spore coat associated protein CotJA n=1 Tax=Paenibacillus sediminis TaxID=664909 RepID=A0ABS4GY18_9BACL|nr:hypothetical protein [Paenibacillus sediminis]MBP1935165.1 hypothetical protein [Paenibacillus sediminis]